MTDIISERKTLKCKFDTLSKRTCCWFTLCLSTVSGQVGQQYVFGWAGGCGYQECASQHVRGRTILYTGGGGAMVFLSQLFSIVDPNKIFFPPRA